MIAFRMPSLGADMDAGTLVEWFKKPGDTVRRGDIIALVETQKGAIEVEVFDDGQVADIAVEPGQKVPVGTVLAHIRAPGEQVPAAEAQPPPPAPVAKAAEPAAEPAPAPVAAAAPAPAAAIVEAPPVSPLPAGERRKVTPAARKRAGERGTDLSAVAPGSDGVIGLRELDAEPAGAPAQPPRRRAGIDMAEMRKAIAAAMTRSHREIPHYWVSHTIDVTALFEWVATENETRPVAARLLYAAPLAKAVARALADTPGLNGHFVDGTFRPADSVHLGIATALRGGGLVAPALHDADTCGLDALMAAMADLVPRARAGRLRSSELTDATATFTNLGEATSDSMMPLIYPPQVAIVACGAAAIRPWVVDEAVVPRRLMTVTVAGDHRVSDGRRASQFLSRLDGLLQKPEAL